MAHSLMFVWGSRGWESSQVLQYFGHHSMVIVSIFAQKFQKYIIDLCFDCSCYVTLFIYHKKKRGMCTIGKGGQEQVKSYHLNFILFVQFIHQVAGFGITSIHLHFTPTSTNVIPGDNLAKPSNLAFIELTVITLQSFYWFHISDIFFRPEGISLLHWTVIHQH